MIVTLESCLHHCVLHRWWIHAWKVFCCGDFIRKDRWVGSSELCSVAMWTTQVLSVDHILIWALIFLSRQLTANMQILRLSWAWEVSLIRMELWRSIVVLQATSHHLQKVLTLAFYLIAEVHLCLHNVLFDRWLFLLAMLVHHRAKVVVSILGKRLELLLLFMVETVLNLLLFGAVSFAWPGIRSASCIIIVNCNGNNFAWKWIERVSHSVWWACCALTLNDDIVARVRATFDLKSFIDITGGIAILADGCPRRVCL